MRTLKEIVDDLLKEGKGSSLLDELKQHVYGPTQPKVQPLDDGGGDTPPHQPPVGKS
jgi:hypothetical protein